MIVNSSNLSKEDIEFLIEESHKNVQNQIKPFLEKVSDSRGRNMKQRDLKPIFKSAGWDEYETKSGHCKHRHVLTRVIAGHPTHNDITAKVAKAVARDLIVHVEKLENEEYKYKADSKNTTKKPKKNLKYKA